MSACPTLVAPLALALRLWLAPMAMPRSNGSAGRSAGNALDRAVGGHPDLPRRPGAEQRTALRLESGCVVSGVVVRGLVPGTVLRLPEDAYRFGVGELTLRVEVLIGIQHLSDGPWAEVGGTVIRSDGSDGDPRRHVLVRMSRPVE